MKTIEQEDGLSLYRIEVHALKGTAATVGAMLLSKLARVLEVAAANGEIQKLESLHPILLEEIEKHRERVATLFPEEKQEIENKELIESYLDMLDISVEQGDYDTADFMIEELKKYQYSKKIQMMMDELAGQVLNMETANVMKTVKMIKLDL
jgi:HPt (histidine-containing phosphotransfer) domain-containing protein